MSRSAPAGSRRAPRKRAGIRALDGGVPERTATSTTIGINAATAPLTPISAVTRATISIITTISRRVLSPAMATILCPAHVVTPVESRPSETTNRQAMKITVGSPKPAKASSTEITPVAASVSGAETATTSTGTLFHTKRTTRPARTR